MISKAVTIADTRGIVRHMPPCNPLQMKGPLKKLEPFGVKR